MKIEAIKKECTGCGACSSVCPTASISMKMSEEGFYYPEINHLTCISCGKCDSVCHCFRQNTDSSTHSQRKSFFGRSKDPMVLNNSTSGGAFYHLAQNILEDGGVVVGAAFDYQDYSLKHVSSDNVPVENMMKSKYLESDMSHTMGIVKKAIAEKRKVLFCGTPCEVSGVKNTIKDPNHLLLTCDFICHGIPSAKLFQEHLKKIEPRDKVIEIDFRPKELGWTGQGKVLKIKTDKHIKMIPYYLDPFYSGFMEYNSILRKSCYNCKYRNVRFSDITIADFWGYTAYDPSLNDEKGLSLIITHTPAGEQAVTSMLNFDLTQIDNKYSDYAFSSRDYSQAEKNREDFFEEYRKYGFEKAVRKTYGKKLTAVKFKYRLRKMLHHLLKAK